MSQLVTISPTISPNREVGGTNDISVNDIFILYQRLKDVNKIINSRFLNDSELGYGAISPNLFSKYFLEVFNSKDETALYLQEALNELQEADQESKEEGFELCSTETKKTAEKILHNIFRRYPRRYSICPTPDREIFISASGELGHGVLIVCGPENGVACFVTRAGQNKRAHYDNADELPDSFILEALRKLGPNS